MEEQKNELNKSHESQIVDSTDNVFSSSAPIAGQSFPTNTPKKSKLPVIISIIVVLLVAGAIGVGWYFLLRDNKPVVVTPPDDSASVVTKDNFAEKLSEALVDIKAKHLEVSSKLVVNKDAADNGGLMFTDSSINFNYLASSPNGWSGTMAGSSTFYSEIIDKLRGFGLNDSQYTSVYNDSDYNIIRTSLEKEDILCSVYTNTDINADNDVVFACVDKLQIAQYLAKTRPYAEAYLKERKTSSESKPAVIVKKEPADSSDGNYMIADGVLVTKPMTESKIYFYKNKKEPSWHYAFIRGAKLSCEEFASSIDKRNAFIDEPCDEPNSGAATTVRKYFKM